MNNVLQIIIRWLIMFIIITPTPLIRTLRYEELSKKYVIESLHLFWLLF
jgi:hypothetical protein